MNNQDSLEKRLINDRFFKTLFINNTNALAKLISDITKIPYSKLKDNIILTINEIPITNKIEKFKKCDFIVKIDNEALINIELNTSKYKGLKTKNLSYSFNLYSTHTKIGNQYNEDLVIIQINLNTFSNKNNSYLDVYELRNKKGTKYIENFKIFTLDIVKCNKLYYDKPETSNNIIKWGAFFYSKTNENNIVNIISSILNKKDLEEISSRLESINMDANGIMSKKEAREWGEWIKNSIIKEGFEQGMEQGMEQGIENNTKNIIKEMIKNNISKKTISKITKKSIKEIDEIINTKKL